MRIQKRSNRGQSAIRCNFFNLMSMVMILVIALLLFEFGSDFDGASPKGSEASRYKNTPKIDFKDTGSSSTSWCDRIQATRSGLDKKLQISYPCEKLQPATSAVVCMLTAGVSDDKQANRIVFTARNYIEGALALGESVRENIDTSQTHMLLLVREGFVLAPDDATRLEAVGWTIGTAPDFDLPQKYVPRFPRYKTTYTKVTAIGLAEYKCAMLMDADTLVVGDIKELMTCKIFTQPQHRVAGTLDYFRKSWYFFNTGSILWRTSVEEMNRVFQLSRDDSFMKRFSSDQEFLNNVYPDRMNKKINNDIIDGNPEEADKGGVVTLPWDYNAQTHAEVEFTSYWREHRSTVKILHFTEKKGWQCDETHTEPVPWDNMPDPCKKEISVCYCRDAHLYWNALRDATVLGDRAIQKRR